MNKMKTYVHTAVYQRVKEIATAQGKTKSCIVQDALVRLLGMEGMPLEDEEVYGQANNTSVSTPDKCDTD